jgi:hypothetical protein
MIASRYSYPLKGHLVTISAHSENGHRSVALSHEGRSRHRAVADLVATAFLGPRPKGMRVLHKDDDLGNNRADNLRYATNSELVRRTLYDRGKGGLGARAYNAKWLILGFGVLAAEPRGATIGPMSDGRSCLPSKVFGCCDGGHRPSAGTDHGFAADDQSDLPDR